MIKLLKHELRNSRTYIGGLLLAALLVSFGLQLPISEMIKAELGGLNTMTTSWKIVVMITSAVVLVGIGIAFLIYIVNSFRKELYEDRGYLTFTLPLSGKQVVGAKLFNALIWSILLSVVLFVANIGLFFGLNAYEEIRGVLSLITVYDGINLIPSLVIGLISQAQMLLLLFFSIALSRVSFGNRKMGGMWFIFYLIAGSVLANLSSNLNDLFPLVLSFSPIGFYLAPANNYNALSGANMNWAIVHEFSNRAIVPIPTGIMVVQVLFLIVTTIILFMATSYLLEKKIDL